MTAVFDKDPVVCKFKSLEEYSQVTGQDKHSVLVDYDVFVREHSR